MDTIKYFSLGGKPRASARYRAHNCPLPTLGNEKPPPTQHGGQGFLQAHVITGSCRTGADPWDLPVLRSLQRYLHSWWPP